jgi:hypothetical protein
MRGGAALGHADPPFQCFEVHLRNVGTAPGFFDLSQRGVENATFAVHLRPGESEIVIGARDVGAIAVI